MIYLLILFFITFYLYSVEKYFSLNFWKQFVLWFPAFVIFSIFPGLQYNVGTDYQTYFQYFYNNEHELYLTKNELIYYYIVEFSKFFGNPQAQFLIVSLIQSILFFYLLFLLKVEGYKSWLVFLIFFLCTGIYHNQMNGLRQYICVYGVPIIAIHLYRKSYLKSLGFSIISFFIHASSLITSFLLYIFSRFKGVYSAKTLFFIFCSTFFLYLLDFKSLIIFILDFFDFRYLLYMDTQYFEGGNLFKLITKMYYLPIIFIFWFLFLKDGTLKDNKLNSFFIFIFSITYFMFFQAMSFELMSRVWQYFNFFLVFPIYYVFVRCNKISFLLILIYILIYYIAKVLFFPAAEYEYNIYRGWF